MRPTWIIQTNVSSEVPRWLDALKACGSQYRKIEIVPFADYLPDLNPPVEGPTICHGTTTLIKNAEKKGWGIFFNPDHFRPSTWNDLYGSNMLNYDGKVVSIGNVDFESEAFVRPNGDFKEFSGSRVDRESFENFRTNVAGGAYHFDLDYEIFVAPLKAVAVEWRCFVVDGKVVSGSRYRLGHMLAKQAGLPADVEEFASNMAKIWSPEKAFVMDICMDRQERLYILELNCFNASGAYLCDVPSIVQAVEALY